MTKKQETEKAETVQDISVRTKGDIAYVNQSGAQLQSMPGFDDDFTDIVDYIIKITHRIWEEKAIGLIYDYYLHNCVVHTSSGDIYGRDAAVTGTIQTLAGFPDRRLFGDEVIWGYDENDETYYSSHRITHEGHNTGFTDYGPPTGRKVNYGAVADCVVKENQVIEEWLVRDGLTLVHQLGLDLHDTARRMAKIEADSGLRDMVVQGEIERLQGQLPPKKMPPKEGDKFDAEDFVRRSFHEIWNWRMLNKVNDYYAENAVCESASMRRMYGHGDFKAYILSLLGPFPDMMISVDHFCVIGDEKAGYRAATRWTMQGTHTGPGVYGKATGKRINIIGVTQQLVQNERITHEWTLFDEFALLKQLYTPD
jgi:predicted ester cyclase